MLYRRMPKIEEALSVLGFGCMRLPVNRDHSLDKPRAIEQIRYAADHGVNYFDTAWPYHSGGGEPLLGQALQDGYRNRVNIATKLPSWMVKDRDNMDYYLNEQLKRLKTDVIDFYLIHNLAGPGWNRLKQMEVLDFIDRAKQSGRIRYAGFSFHGRLDDFKTIVDDYPWEFCQIQYNYLDEERQAGTRGLKYAAQKNLGVIIMEPLRGGNLGLVDPPKEVAAIWNRASKTRTPAEWALSWVMDHPEVTTVLSGMNEETHIKENIEIAKHAIPSSFSSLELDLVKQVSKTYKKLMKVDCTGCEYCKPCPEGVNIPIAFDSFNKLHMFENDEEIKTIYAVCCSGLLTGIPEPGYASNCTQCGECLDKCPQNIPIPELLAEAVRDLEDDGIENRIIMAKKMLNME
ncbi:MAG: aldo/keto reductase [Desulfobacteraceae bacterium]|nr:aldo/keto reductase [Desulfobacteraceae bacterium]